MKQFTELCVGHECAFYCKVVGGIQVINQKQIAYMSEMF
jgi:hypothetical protein